MTQIQQIPVPSSPQFGQSVKNWIETRDGTLGIKGLRHDRFVTLRDLYDSVFFSLIMAHHAVVQSTGSAGGFGAAAGVTIASGSITLIGTQKWRFHSIDTQGNAATDDLDTINGGNVGDIFIGQATNNARTVVCKDGISLKLQRDFSLNNIEDKIILLCISSGVWHEVSRVSNGG